MEVESKINENI